MPQNNTNEVLLGALRGAMDLCRGFSPPSKAALYEHLADNFDQSVSELRAGINKFLDYLQVLIESLELKRSRPFDPMSLEVDEPSVDLRAGEKCINEIVRRHNALTSDFEKEVSAARVQLEQGLVAEAMVDFLSKQEAVRSAHEELSDLRRAEQGLSSRIAELEREIVEHRRPAEELNAELQNYLGRDELRFELSESGYVIKRRGFLATDLSEGERTAIAFLYFLKSLQDKGFSLKKGIVVIDDPVSSLDVTALFCAFGFMKERTNNAGQLFVLTHNASFFRQVKNWFNHLPDQRKRDPSLRPGRFYMISSIFRESGRTALLSPLDPLLRQYESDYHYLFKIVFFEALRPAGEVVSLESFYPLPNLARRLLESFLGFRYPGQIGEIRSQLESVSFDPARKSRILRFLNTYSHGVGVGELEHDLSILAETPQVLKDVLDLIESEDPRHFAEMKRIVEMYQRE